MNSDSNKENFISICREKIRRTGREELLEWLELSDFFSAPASTKYHGCYEGGLCEHSLNVYDQLLLLLRTYNLTTSEETAAIVALFHDLCKVNFYKKSTRNVKDENGKWVEKEFWTIEEQSPLGDHADKSIIIIQQFMKLTEQEIYTIRAHMGGFDTSVKGGSYFIGKIFEKSGLALLLHCADLTATYLLESKSKEALFAALPQREDVLRVKADMLANLEDKFNALLDEGKNEAEATGIVVASIGSGEELREQFGLQATAPTAVPAASVIPNRFLLGLFLLTMVPLVMVAARLCFTSTAGQ